MHIIIIMIVMQHNVLPTADGHHKLILWRMVTHAAIDGFSRLIIFLRCSTSTNNQASTVYNQFLQGVSQYGLPSRVRTDQGRENILVARHMLRHRGIKRRSVLVGSSVHNQRIERLWRDSHRCITTSMFYRLFSFLEENGQPDPISDEDLYMLSINRSLTQFIAMWNEHGLHTERGQTPKQLFTAGALSIRHSGLHAVDFFESVSDDYGINEKDASADGVGDEEVVEVPIVSLTLTEEQLSELHQSVSPLYDSNDDYGISLYARTVQMLTSWLASNRPEGLGVTVYACAKIPTKRGNPDITVNLSVY